MFLLNNYKLVKELAKDISKPRYASELAKTLKLNQKSVSNALHKLEQERILDSKFEGKNKVFHFKAEQLKPSLIALEAEKKRLFLKDTKLHLICEKLSEAIPGNFLVFGSYAKEKHTERSDLDILVIGRYDDDIVEETEDIYKIEINIQKFSEEQFKNAGNRGHILINEIDRGHVVMRGIEFFIDAFTTWNPPPGASKKMV